MPALFFSEGQSVRSAPLQADSGLYRRNGIRREPVLACALWNVLYCNQEALATRLPGEIPLETASVRSARRRIPPVSCA